MPTDGDKVKFRNQKDKIEINSVEQKYIKHDRWGQEWLMLHYDIGAAVAALPVAVAEKRGEFRVALRDRFADTSRKWRRLC